MPPRPIRRRARECYRRPHESQPRRHAHRPMPPSNATAPIAAIIGVVDAVRGRRVRATLAALLPAVATGFEEALVLLVVATAGIVALGIGSAADAISPGWLVPLD